MCSNTKTREGPCQLTKSNIRPAEEGAEGKQLDNDRQRVQVQEYEGQHGVAVVQHGTSF